MPNKSSIAIAMLMIVIGCSESDPEKDEKPHPIDFKPDVIWSATDKTKKLDHLIIRSPTGQFFYRVERKYYSPRFYRDRNENWTPTLDSFGQPSLQRFVLAEETATCSSNSCQSYFGSRDLGAFQLDSGTQSFNYHGLEFARLRNANWLIPPTGEFQDIAGLALFKRSVPGIPLTYRLATPYDYIVTIQPNENDKFIVYSADANEKEPAQPPIIRGVRSGPLDNVPTGRIVIFQLYRSDDGLEPSSDPQEMFLPALPHRP
jgi:hypothetical protein